jgi:hypothetical protein
MGSKMIPFPLGDTSPPEDRVLRLVNVDHATAEQLLVLFKNANPISASRGRNTKS